MLKYSVTVEPRGRYWQARCYFETEGGRSVRFSTQVEIGDDHNESKRAATLVAIERAEGIAKERSIGVVSKKDHEHALDTVAERMLAQKRVDRRRPRTVASLASILDRHVLPYFGAQRDVRTIRRKDVEGFKIKLAKDHEPVTVNNCLTAIRQVLKYACHVDESIESVPVVANLPTDPRGSGMSITAEQAAKYLASFADDEVDEREFNLFLFNTGLRKTETLAMCWSWVDWEARVIRIPGEFRKGGREQRVPTTMTTEVYKLLRARLKRDKQPKNGRIWFNLKRSGKKKGRDYDKARARAAAKAGIPGFRHHDARHTRATLLAANGASEMDLRDAMNWETTAMANRYTHPTHDRVKLLAATVQISGDPSRASPSRKTKKTKSPTKRGK